LEGQTPNNCKSRRLLGGTRRLVFSKREAQDLNQDIPEQKNVHQCLVSVQVKFVDLISLKHQYRYMKREGKMIRTDGHKLLLDALKLIGISRSDRVPNYQGIF
jgi:hypothetical protein